MKQAVVCKINMLGDFHHRQIRVDAGSSLTGVDHHGELYCPLYPNLCKKYLTNVEEKKKRKH